MQHAARTGRREMLMGKPEQKTPLEIRRLVLRRIIKLNSVVLVRERIIPTERPPPVGEVSANFCG